MHDDNFAAPAQDKPLQYEINTTRALLISVFGAPFRADPEANIYEWHLNFPDNSHANISNQSANPQHSARIQTWLVVGSNAAAITHVKAALAQGENYYEGPLHPELFANSEPS
jgi:hypothetical protein